MNRVGQLFQPYLSQWLRDRVGTPWSPGSVYTCSATILYADLSGFTRLTSAFATLPDGAEQLDNILSQLYTAIVNTVLSFKGDVASIAGDALTVWWPECDDKALAQSCATAMHDALVDMTAIATPQGSFKPTLRIGIASGLVQVAFVGLPSYGAHLTLSGPPITAATNAERRTAPGTTELVAQSEATNGPALRPNPDYAADKRPGSVLRVEHFLPSSFIERLRINTLVAEYRRCLPVFAAFSLPEQVEEFHHLVVSVQEIVARWGGWLSEIEIGDKGSVFVLLFGALRSHGDDAVRAVSCCAELRTNKCIEKAGITIGSLFVGSIGSTQRKVYTARGDEMNLAAHLMQSATQGAIVVSGRVQQEIAGRYQVSKASLVTTKGYPTGLPVFQVLEPIDTTSHSATGKATHAQPAATGLIGRVGEQRQIAEAVRVAQAGVFQVVTVEGESGIGKSRLLHHATSGWITRPHNWLEHTCVSSHQAIPLASWRNIVMRLCNIDHTASTDVQLDQLQHVLAQTSQGNQYGYNRHLLGYYLGITTWNTNAYHQQHPPFLPSRQKDWVQFYDTIADLLLQDTATAPRLVVIEDMHWADEYSWELLAHLVERATVPKQCSLLIICSYRPLSKPIPKPLTQVHRHQRCKRLTLGRLSGIESRQLACEVLNAQALQPTLEQYIERHSEGQPLFIKEYIRALRHHDLIVVENETATLTARPLNVQVSDATQGVIQARMDRLDEATRLTLKVAAVIGQTFAVALLHKIHPMKLTRAALDAQLRRLTHLQIIEPEFAGPEPFYRFKYGVTHDVAYTNLLFSQRRALHHTAALWYEATYKDDIAQGRVSLAVYDVLIEHFGSAEDHAKVVQYCRDAAIIATEQHTIARALGYLNTALVLSTDPVEQYSLLLLRVAINEHLSNTTMQTADITALAALVNAIDDPLHLTRQLYVGYYQLRHAVATERYQVAIALGIRLIQIVDSIVPTLNAFQQHFYLLRASYLDSIAMAYSTRRNFKIARTLQSQALAMYRTAVADTSYDEPSTLPEHNTLPFFDPHILIAHCLDHMGTVALQTNQTTQARAHYDEALRYIRQTNDWISEARIQEHIGQVLLAQGDYVAAHEYVTRALRTSRSIGDHWGQLNALRQISVIEAMQRGVRDKLPHTHRSVAVGSNADPLNTDAQAERDA